MAKIDYNLLYLKAENARTSLKELSNHLKKSPQRLKYSLSVLEKDKVIRDPYCVFDYSYFGLILFRVYFKGGYISDQDKVRIIKELSNNPYVTSIYELTGEYDLAVEFASPNPSKFNKELKRISTLTPTLNDYKIVLNVVTYLYPMHYLTNSQNLHHLNIERIVGGDRERENFNENEMVLIKNMLLNPTMNFTDLAAKSDLNIKTIKSILKNLKKRNIIKSFKYIIDTNSLGINKFRLFLKLHNLSPEREAQLMGYMLNTKEIIQVNKTVGDWDMELDIESPDKTRSRYIIRQVREEFKDLIERFNIIEFYTYYKRSFLPLYLFKEEKKHDKNNRRS